jgi:hypothetical protein
MMQRFPTTGWFRFRRSLIASLPGALSGAIAAGLIFFVALSSARASSQTSKVTDYDVEAAYLIDFGRFVRPAGQQQNRSSFDICVLGKDSFGTSLDSLASNEKVSNLPIHVRHPDVTQSRSCAIVYISSLEHENVREDLALLANTEVLTVSDAEDFLQRGGMIQFVAVENHVRFAVNLDAVNRAHLVLSSELLRVAFYVIGKPSPGGQP